MRGAKLNTNAEPWTEEEDLIVLHMYTEDDNGFTAKDVAVAIKALGHVRSENAIRARSYQLRKHLARDFTPRPCSDVERLANHLPWVPQH